MLRIATWNVAFCHRLPVIIDSARALPARDLISLQELSTHHGRTDAQSIATRLGPSWRFEQVTAQMVGNFLAGGALAIIAGTSAPLAAQQQASRPLGQRQQRPRQVVKIDSARAEELFKDVAEVAHAFEVFDGDPGPRLPGVASRSARATRTCSSVRRRPSTQCSTSRSLLFGTPLRVLLHHSACGDRAETTCGSHAQLEAACHPKTRF